MLTNTYHTPSLLTNMLISYWQMQIMISSPGPPLPRQAEGVPCPFPPPPWLSLLSRYLYYLPSPTLVIQPLRAESARAVTGRQCPHSGEGEDFLTCQPGFFYENSCKLGMESRKLVPKLGNERSLRELRTGFWSKLGWYGKNRIFFRKPRFQAKKKFSLLYPNH